MKNRKLFERVMAIALAAVTTLIAPLTSVHAAVGDIGRISFAHTYDTNIMPPREILYLTRNSQNDKVFP